MFAAAKSLIGTLSPGQWFGVLLSAALIYSGWWTRGVYESHLRAEELKAQVALKAEAEERMAERSKQTEAELARLRTVNRQITAIMERELAKDAYRCPVPADGVRLLNDAAAAANAAR